jgi:hypothetical protein
MAKKTKKLEVKWAEAPAEHDYPAAKSFLGLIAGPDLIEACIQSLSQAPTVHQHAKDILRDGYHRVCASYHVNENTDIPCRLTRLPVSAA